MTKSKPEVTRTVPRRHCWKSLRRHRWGRKRYRHIHHEFKYCMYCDAKRMTKHLSCPISCWGGPG